MQYDSKIKKENKKRKYNNILFKYFIIILIFMAVLISSFKKIKPSNSYF